MTTSQTRSSRGSHTPQLEKALSFARQSAARSVEALASVVRIPSLTGEEAAGQAHMAGCLKKIGAEVTVEEPDVAAMFARFPSIAQYPTHWQHDLILPYEELPTYEALNASGLENVLNYRNRPNVVGVVKGQGGGRSLILNTHIDTVTLSHCQNGFIPDILVMHTANQIV